MAIAIGSSAQILWPAGSLDSSSATVRQVVLVLLLSFAALPFAIPVGPGFLGLRGPRKSTLPLLAFPTMTVALGYLAGLRLLDIAGFSLSVALVAIVAINEEVVFRGILLHSLRRRGLWDAVLTSSALFGLMHLANLVLGTTPSGTLVQIVFAAMAGVGYAAMRLVTGSLWPGIALHAAFDFSFRLTALESGTMFGDLIFMLHGPGWLIWGVLTLRRAGLEHEEAAANPPRDVPSDRRRQPAA